MAAHFRSTSPDDLPRIQDLLRTAFNSSSGAPNLEPDLLRWKYYEPGPRWNGSRSYAMEQDGKLLAHGSVWPVKIQGVVAANLLDWAAVKFPPGMGVSLVRRLAEISPVLISTGGSKATRSIMPRIGFHPIPTQCVYVRVLRPLKQHRTRPSERAVRAFPRLIRNAMWSIAPPVPLRQWTASRVNSLPDRAANHLLHCPAASVTAWSLEHPRGQQGYFVLSRVGGQSRIARLRIDSLRWSDWTAAYAVAVRIALDDPEACELVALSSSVMVNEALETNHFHLRDHRPVFVHDPRKLIPPDAHPLEFDMLDDDFAYMNTPEYPYFA